MDSHNRRKPILGAPELDCECVPSPGTRGGAELELVDIGPSLTRLYPKVGRTELEEATTSELCPLRWEEVDWLAVSLSAPRPPTMGFSASGSLLEEEPEEDAPDWITTTVVVAK